MAGSSERDAGAPPLAPRTSARLQPLVLLADADEQASERLASLIQKAGWDVRFARTGFAAIVKASCLSPDVIIVREGLPGLEGWGTVELLATCPLTRGIPIVGQSADAAPSTRETAIRAGCVQLLTPPLDDDGLTAALENLRSIRPETSWPAAPLSPATEG